MRKINKIKKRLITLLIIIFLCLGLVYSYYTNTNKFFSDSRKPDGNSGFGLQRSANEFIVNGSGAGTMLDTVTGLTWDMNLNHNGSTLNWSINNTYTEPIWNDSTKVYDYPSGRTKSDYPAFSYCEDLVQGNYDDYRLPSREELMTLINEIGTSGSTCTTLTSFGFINCHNNYYWTSKESQLPTSDAWYVKLSRGFSKYYNKTAAFYVVCVR